MKFSMDMPSGFYWCRHTALRLGKMVTDRPCLVMVTDLTSYRKKTRREVVWWMGGRDSLQSVVDHQSDTYTFELEKIPEPTFAKQ